MDSIIGIDLGTTNSVVAVIQDARPEVLHGQDQSAILPSVVGITSDGRLLVGEAARNQALLAPERTVKSIKRKMGLSESVHLAEKDYTPQEISAIILRTLKKRAEEQLGQPVSKAVITVPAFFTENQREATREAGELAGLEVVRIINEPTAATLTYQPRSERNERLLVYDLGGGTFDVSIVQIEQGVIEVLASHGDTNLGGDDFDQLLLDEVADSFFAEHGIDLRTIPVARSRLLQAVEEAKKRLSSEAVTSIAEEFIAEKDGTPLNLQIELDRHDYERLIEPLLKRTLQSVDTALAEAKLTSGQIDRTILVGGSSRTPMVQRLLEEQLGQQPHWEIDPDLCVALGAAVQGGLIAGVDVGAVLVDITPHTLGIQVVGELHGRMTNKLFSPIIQRNTALPATRSEIYYTGYDGQEAARIHVLQGEHEDVTFNESVGEFLLEGLDDQAEEGNEILVRFDLDLDGILMVTAIERDTGLEKQLRLENAITRFRESDREQAKTKLDEVFGEPSPVVELQALQQEALAAASDQLVERSDQLVAKGRQLVAQASPEDAQEIQSLIESIEQAQSSDDRERLQALTGQLDDLLFYVEDA